MSYTTVIARAYPGEPRKMVLIDKDERLAYLANPGSIEAVEAGESIPIGYPISDVYGWDSEVYQVLRTEYARSGAISGSLWNKLRPLLA